MSLMDWFTAVMKPKKDEAVVILDVEQKMLAERAIYPLALDIETAELGDFNDLSTFTPSCVCVYDSLTDEDFVFVDDDCYSQRKRIKQKVLRLSQLDNYLQEWFSKGRRILGHNTEGFDFPVLKQNGLGIGLLDAFCESGRSIDTKKLLEKQYNLLVSLQNIVEGSIGDSKSMNGADAPVYWGRGEYEEVIEYCIKDARLTYAIWLYGRENGGIEVMRVKLPISW